MTSRGAPLISVVIPCFNTERYVGEAIDSILAQAIDSVQVVAIDDGSTDRSPEILRNFGDRIECHSQANAGIAAARNAGIALARGRYLAFLDADDVWTPGSLALRLDRLAAGADCVFGGIEHFLSPELTAAERERCGTVPITMTGRFASSMLIERRAFDRVGLFDPALAIGEMFDWVARAEDSGITIALIDDVVVRRRIHGNNTVIRRKNEQGEYLKALRNALARRRDAALGQGGRT
jgi:glycosyltransferase involved in cell wall biosynthesis